MSIKIAKCAEHGLHGERETCFICNQPVDQVELFTAEEAREARLEAWRAGFEAAQMLADASASFLSEIPSANHAAKTIARAMARQRDKMEALYVAHHVSQHRSV